MIDGESRFLPQAPLASSPVSDDPPLDALGAAAEREALRTEVRQLREALGSRAVIDQARGIVMTLASCSTEEGWLLLVQMSQHSNVKLRDVSAALVAAAGGEPLPVELEQAYRHMLP
ncbi:ANTAR domain-containing protein [Streptomyces phytohabitans]|uniref:ANTAR domain-containing protein n=1 Tax=Streptomyces phytohabitans TaxID=1150371 RepID=UPI00345BF985